ncbi:MAG: hypothetical protein IT438_06800 [Phycisphaerales bacterium]|nr:hypothetical protein [Phycisphaerales bacterium]
MARLNARVGRLERTHAAIARATMPRLCTCCGGVDPETGTGPLRGCTAMDQGDGTDLVICRMCPRAWRGRLDESGGKLVLTGGVPAETPF